MKPKNLRKMELVLFDIDEFLPIGEQVQAAMDSLDMNKMIVGFVVRNVEGF